MTSPFLYLPGRRLALAELCAARLDGHVVEVGTAYMPADAVETAELRAGSLLDLLGPGLVAVRLTAAWVHGALDDPPEPHTAQRASVRRTTMMSTPRLVYSDVVLAPEDAVRLSGVLVTTPARTLVDLVRSPDPAHRAAADELVRALPASPSDALALLEHRRGLPGARAARAELRRRQDEVTR